MSQTVTNPGWYYAQGDPPGTERYWDGQQWQGGPQLANGAGPAGFGMVDAVDADRSPLAWFRLALTRWNQFDGRSTRAEYWWFTLFHIVFIALPMFLAIVLAETALSAVSVLLFIIVLVYALAMIIPSLAVAVRRLHDTNKSGWMLLLGMIPIVNYIGSFILLFFYCSDGDRGSNQYGASPKYAPGTAATWGAAS